MKKIVLIMLIFVISKTVYATNIEIIDYKSLPLAKEYNEYTDFDINKIPEGMFYKLAFDCKYILNVSNQLYIKGSEWGGVIVYYNKNMIDLGFGEENGFDFDNPRTSVDSSIYLIRSNNEYYIFVDKMYFYDSKGYNLYHLLEDKIEIVEDKSGRIDFVGYDYIIGYTDLGMIGYQQCEFKKVFRDGKFELDGEYKVVEDADGCQFWVYYTLVKDLKFEEYDDKSKIYVKKVLKAGIKIRTLSTDAKSYIRIETVGGRKGKVKVDKVDGRDFIVNGKKFMNFYFLDGSKYDYEVFRALPAY